MKQRKAAITDMVLTAVWLLTAAMVLILTVVYINRLQKLYAKADQVSLENTAQTVPDDGRDNAGIMTETAQAGKISDVTAGQTGGQENTGTAGTDIQEVSEAAGSDEQDLVQTADRTIGNGEAEAGTEADETGSETVVRDGDAPAEGANGDNNVSEGGTGDGAEEAAEGGAGDGAEGAAEDDTVIRENYDYSLGLDPSKPIIALSFDDGPSIYTARIVAALQANQAEATFFMVGYNVKEYKDAVRLVYNSGMEIGNHTTDHKKLTELSKADIRSEVFDNEDLINAIVPVGRIVVRPPYGSHNSTVRSVVARPMFNWSVDSLDWKTRNADSIVAQIQQDARDGYIILMHDLYETTAEAAERIIPWLIDQGYQVTCISKMFKARGEKTEDGEVYRNVAPAGE